MVDNLITMTSIDIIQIKDAIARNGIHVHADIIKFLDLIESKNFNSTKCWLAEELIYKQKKVLVSISMEVNNDLFIISTHFWVMALTSLKYSVGLAALIHRTI